jgi:poly(glycerol-phosphate) alpha-glucosyltransferase
MNQETIRVVVVTHSLSRQAGGLFIGVRRFAQGAAAQGLDVRIHGLADAHAAADLPAWQPLVPTAHRTAGPANLGHAPTLWPALKRDVAPGAVMHLHGVWKLTSLATLSISRARGVPRIVSPHGMLDAWALSQGRARKRLAGWLYENGNLGGAACLHAVCDAERLQLRACGWRNPIAVIPNGTDLPDETGAPPDPNTEPLLPPDKRVLLFLSRVHPKKGLPLLIRAWERVAPQFPDWLLAIVGPDENGHEAEIRVQAKAARLEDRVRLLGPRYGAARDGIFRRADAFVLPSYSEGFPMAALESLAYRVPVLLTPMCNFPEAMAAGAGLEVRTEPDSLADGLCRMLAMPSAERRAMGERGRQLVTARYTWRELCARMREVYEWVLGRRERPACVRSD